VHTATADVPAGHAASFSGILATINQLAIVTGIAVAGTLYLSAGRVTALPPMSVVLLAIAVAQAVTGIAVPASLARSRRMQPTAPVAARAGLRAASSCGSRTRSAAAGRTARGAAGPGR
jgi:hypothetical protein